MKNQSILKKISPLLLLVGITLIIASLAITYVQQRFDNIAVILASIGALLCFMAMLFLRNTIGEFFALLAPVKYVQKFLLIVAVLIAIICINWAAVIYDIRWDMTKAKQHTVTKVTKDTLSTLKKDVKVTVFYVGLAPKYIEDLLGEYKRLSSGRIQTEIVDPLVQIGYAAQFGNVISGDEKRAIVQCGSERQDIDFKKNPLTEALLTNAIIKTMREKRNIYFTVGHEEYDIEDTSPVGFSTFARLMEDNNSVNNKLMLGIKKEVPEDCDVLVVSGARLPFTDDEYRAVQDYLKKGGKALFFIESWPVGTKEKPLAEYEKRRNPSLNKILNYWGLEIGDDLVVDIENYIGGDIGCPATKNYPPHDQIVKNLDYTFFIRPRSIMNTKAQSNTVKVAPLVQTASSKSSWAETDEFLHVKFDKDSDMPGPISIGAILWEPKNENKKDDTKIIVFTDADFASNNFINQYSNAQLAINSLGWLTSLDNVMPIEKQSEEDSIEKLELTSKQKRLIIVILIAIPLLIAAIGSLSWSWRFNK